MAGIMSIPGGANRFIIRYSANQAYAMNVEYTLQDGSSVKDRLFLEAGENRVFRFLILGYLEGKQAETLNAAEYEGLQGEKAEITVHSIDADLVPVYDTDCCEISGKRYTVGIKLRWGGGICELLDNENPVKDMRNLVNQYDTGRLIQQSYYGTSANGVYAPGSFNGSTWCYNPVQGGNKYNQPSRLIDVSVSDNRVYVRCQPGDWSGKDWLTLSYMENTYTVYEDRVEVYNRFVDFSGWDHGVKGQELPAFYTVSYLGSFVHYTGKQSWTGDRLNYENDLNFWGDSRYSEQCTFPIREDQTETWCAWVNPEDDYGIGLYVPGCDVLFAGRYKYNNSKSALDGATNYVAPLNKFRMLNYEPREYSYLLACGSVQEIRSTFAGYRDFADNRDLRKDSVSIRSRD